VSYVTDVFVIIGDSEDGRAEDIAPRVAEAVHAFIGLAPEYPIPVISLPCCPAEGTDIDMCMIQGGNKYAGSAALWIGWNYGCPEELEAHLKGLGFMHITVWSHKEDQGIDGVPPRVVSW
jgi:hypothetical protein